MKIKKSQIKEMAKRMLKEGSSFDDQYTRWQWLLEHVGADKMLECIYQWSSTDQIEQYLDWFKDEDYFYGSEFDEVYEGKLATKIKRMVTEALNEVSGWTLEEDDIEWVNDKGDDYYNDDEKWIVRLWPGSGYYLPAFGVYARDEEEALYNVVAYLDKKGQNGFFVDDYIESERAEMEQQGMSNEEIWDKLDNDERYMYVDATMEGASEPHYIYAENLNIYPYSKFNNR